MECKNRRYVVDPFIASEAVNYPWGTDAVETSAGEAEKQSGGQERNMR